jgi:DNA replication protein DnaC
MPKRTQKRRPPRGRTSNRVPPEQPLREQLLAHLQRLGLMEIDPRLDSYLSWAHEAQPSYLAFLGRLLGEVAAIKRTARIERRFALSGLKVKKTLSAFDWAFQPKLDRRLFEELAEFDFVRRHEDLVITGKTGTGKSHILQAMVLLACEREIPVRYARCADLLEDLYSGLADGSYERRHKRWCRPQLLVIDDVGLGQIKRGGDEPTAAHMLFNLIDCRHDQASTAITSNIRLSDWGRYLGDATITAAILDRLAMASIRIDIDGPSYRQHLARQRAKERVKRTSKRKQ